ncbi:hypothetical protein [Microcoleus phage My-WqHQDG]|nr:hypothetical protein [Microcoleus phage My-WqHQDG]
MEDELGMYLSLPAMGPAITIASVTTELRNIADGLVQGSLSQYVTYGLKEVEVLEFLADPKADLPSLNSEAALRGISTEALVKLIQSKATSMKHIVRGLELLRVELGARYEAAPNKLALRDEILNKAKALAKA